ncbi:hypothetical protein Cri9333_2328 [Crinalium epipsammum PCC 9333]|uniref:Uncharacterized protein n=1 Tax=Crinalium epipsammum PCC 9333 TaxID=1173022 RepID=K9W0C9_9CYAN|nr:hypothetical protein [Crinalium epipsammum]AFZ13197.1 hypothetical protein Cri9333_2328 [Crinalium epipsammum PCC 9333]
MSSSVEKSSSPNSLLSGQNVVYAGIAWSVLALLFYLLFSISVPGEERPFWYSMGTYFFEEVPFLAAALLCFRNWRSPQIASGRNVWLGIGLGLLSFFIGNLFFGWWELYWGLDPAVSPGDLFYVLFYVCLGCGLVLAILPRRLNLEPWQWATVIASAVSAIALAIWLLSSPPANAQEASAIAQPARSAIASTPITQQRDSNTPSQTLIAQKAPNVKVTPKAPATKAPPVPANTSKNQPPGWVLSLEKVLEPLAAPLSLFYIAGDVFLLIIAALLLLAFWGGRFAQSWRMIAAAAFSFYIADMWFTYATDHITDYQSGFLLEVFWVFSGVLFAIGAALEYDNSIRSRRAGRKRA